MVIAPWLDWKLKDMGLKIQFKHHQLSCTLVATIILLLMLCIRVHP
jgi:hypothetical protein